MNCKEFSKFLNDYLINKIAPKKKKLVEEHIKRCPKCRRELKIEYEIKEVFKNIAEYEISPHFKEKVLTQIYKKSDVFPKKFPIFKTFLLDKNSLSWIIFGFLIPLILMPFSLVIFSQSEKIKKFISQLNLIISNLSPAQISIINFIIATPILLYGFWLTFKFLREKK
ncbi:zf-HC2 domain-containing protein [Candidatus Aminicenantes bacterium AC-335-A11]|jgi:hypothetical protein|nr:zf-HC2 domain-containing protein [SCandidatus Aminicenantes bacterium Aminicenantia_JdfR_composite]MCP2597791.1 zf-HC2 domain-containing protein [Candidatus Aminicenantes bacterium AC-335-L06]MCP2618472.1 zf-HC2 domain-containing protein [Candidatus Aminicenantes bacterium AC-335-A11]MCP2620516.1 zf-HC2 domain-containing protein [Candidatus Aminicenantes bacterium AC-334-E05]